MLLIARFSIAPREEAEKQSEKPLIRSTVLPTSLTFDRTAIFEGY